LGSPGHVFFSCSKPGTYLGLDEMRDLSAGKNQGVLLELPPRSMYVFLGFARYALCHGVPHPEAGPEAPSDRITITWRSVKPHPQAEADPPWPLPTPEDAEADGVVMYAQRL
ncbi:unnamed protein product, partial [Polarella glacialis]